MTERSPYVAVPRDLESNAAFTALSRDAQWLLQHLERDPYRLKCGVFQYNERLTARTAKATTSDVAMWWAELIDQGWIIEDEDTGEAWLTQHMVWDNTLANPNHAKAVQRDIKRVKSPKLARLVEKMLFARWPNLNPTEGIDPGWTDPTDSGDEGHPDAMSNGTQDGIADGTPNPRSPEHVTRSTTPDTRDPQPDPPDTEPEPAPRSRTGAQCEICGGDGISGTGACECPTGQMLKSETEKRRHLEAVKDTA